MSRATVLTPQFVESIPDGLTPGVLYISIPYRIAVHQCACGCGHEVVTPLSPADWRLTYDGESVSLDPSIGNWSFECQSHYWIRRNRVDWAPRWSKEQIARGRAHDKAAQTSYYSGQPVPTAAPTRAAGLWARVKSWWHRPGA